MCYNKGKLNSCTHLHVSQDPRRHYDKWPVGVRPYPWRHQFLRADSLRATSLARPRHVWRGAAGHLPVGRRGQATVCIQCLVRLHRSDRPTASRRISRPQQGLRLLSAGPAVVRRAAEDIRPAALRQNTTEPATSAVQPPPTPISCLPELWHSAPRSQ